MGSFGPAQGGSSGGNATFANLTITGTVTADSVVTGSSLNTTNAWMRMYAPSDGVVILTDSSFSGLSRLCLGVATSAGAAIGRIGTSLVVQLGDGTLQTGVASLAAASLRIGLAPSATPVAQTLTIGESSRPGIDTNVAGAPAVIRTGLGTGTGAPATGSLQGPIVAASGTDTQTYGTVLQWTGTKIGLYGKTPVVQAASVAVDGGGAVAVTGATATGLQVKLDAIIVALTNLGILA